MTAMHYSPEPPCRQRARGARITFAITALLLVFTCGPASAARNESLRDSAPSEPYEKALREMNEGAYDAAVIHLKNTLQENPDHIPARILLGRAYLRQGLGRAAEKELRNALRRGADEDHIFVPLGNALLLQRKYEAILNDIISSTPGYTGGFEVLTIRGRANYELNRLDAAEADFDQAIALAPTQVNPLLGRALVDAARGKWDDALARVSRALDLDPESAEAWFRRAEILRSIGEIPSALAAYDRALELAPGHMRARIGRASLSLNQGNLETARGDAEFVTEASPSNVAAAFLLWQTLLRQGDLEGAEAAFRKAADRISGLTDEMIKTQPSLVRIAALIAVARGEFERANHNLTRLVLLTPHDASVRKLLAEVQLRLGDSESAARTLLELSKKRPDNVGILTLLGEAYMQQRHFREASYVLERAVALTPDSDDVRTQLALSRIGAGETDSAIEDLKKIVDLRSSTTSSAILLTTLQLRRGEIGDALATVAKLDHFHPDNPVVKNLLGTVLLAVPDRAAARDAFTGALAIDPAFVPAMFNLAQMSLDAGDAAAAEARFQSILEIEPRTTAALLGLAEVAAARNDDAGAIKALERAIATDASDRKPFVRLIELHLEAGDPSAAARVAEKLTETHFDSMEAHEMLARTKAAQGKRDAAMLYFRRAKSAAGFSGADLLRIARSQVEIQDFDGARATLIQATGSERELDAHAAIVRLDLLLGDLDTAQVRANTLRDEHPDEALGHTLVAEVLMARADFEGAEKAYRQAIASETGSETEAVIGLADALFAAGRPDEGIEALADWLVDHPGNLYVERERALRLILMQRLDEAQSILERLDLTVPNDPITLTTLARCYQLKGDSRARATARKAYALRPDWSVSADTLGWILVTEGNAREGLKLLRDAFSRDKNPLTRFHIASALSELGRRDEARRELEAILRRGDELPWIAAAQALYDETE